MNATGGHIILIGVPNEFSNCPVRSGLSSASSGTSVSVRAVVDVSAVIILILVLMLTNGIVSNATSRNTAYGNILWIYIKKGFLRTGQEPT